MSDEAQKTQDQEDDDRFELLTGLIIAVFAAVLSLNGLGGGKFGGDETIANIDKSNQYSWFQSKSIKKTLAEGNVTAIETQIETGGVPEDKKETLDNLLKKFKGKVEKYDHETKIILDGSSKYKSEAWFEKLDDDMKEVTGAKEHEEKANGLNDAGDIFDYGELFLQLCLVLGAISLVIKQEKMKRGFLGGMILFGIIGTVFTVMAFQAAWKYL